MFLEEIPENIFTTTIVKIRYDCNGGFERCGKEWKLKYKDAKLNFEKNKGKHICRKCHLTTNNPSKRPEVIAKIMKTHEDRYGGLVVNSLENIKKRRQECFTPERIKIRNKKRIETCQEKYGTDHPVQSQEVRQKQKDTLMNNYGVEVPLKSPEIVKKMQETNEERYGVKNVMQVPEIQLKMAQTTFDKYGVEHYNQLPEMKDYLRENCREWLAESYANPWAKGITRPEEWNEKQSETMTSLYQEGKIFSGCLVGKYHSCKCKKSDPLFRSSYELKTHWYLDNNPETEWYDYEPFAVIYYDTEGKKRRYTIDFIVKFINTNNLLAIEVKNDFSKNSEAAANKKNAFVNECSKLCNYEFWANDKIKNLNLDLDEILKSDKIELYNNKSFN